MSKKTKGILKYTAKDCRKNIERLEGRLDYDKISEAFGEINAQIKEALTDGEFSVKVGRTFPNSVLPVLVFSCDWDKDDSIFITNKEWAIIVKTLNDAGFTVKEDKNSSYLSIRW